MKTPFTCTEVTAHSVYVIISGADSLSQIPMSINRL